jgi:hypothetical protein
MIRAEMTTEFKLTPHADFLHVALAPGYEIRPEGAAELMKSVSDVCARQGQRRVLIEGTIAARYMATMDSFAVGTLAGSMLAGVSLACCFYGYKPDEKSLFFKDVAQNRGVRVEFFGDRDEALRWLGVGPAQPV